MTKRAKDRPLRRRVFSRLGQWSVGRAPFGDGSMFLFFNHAVVGGADFVHLRLVEAVADAMPTVFFTLPADPQPLLARFVALAHVEQLGTAFRGHAGRYFLLGQLAARINQHPRPVLLGGNSRLYYELLPLLRPEARCIDLLHAVASVEHFSLPYAPRLQSRAFINASVRDAFAALYAGAGLDESLKQRMTLIENCVDVPAAPPVKETGPLRVLFVGRGSPEKRVHLVGRIAAECCRRAIAADFDLVGDCEAHVEPADRAACRFAGLLQGPDAIAPFYARAHTLLLTSTREGFPLVVMEAMAQGAVPVCTNVGGIAEHVLPGTTGVLLPAEDDAAVVNAAVNEIVALAADRARLSTLAVGAHRRALERFGAHRFRAAWRELLLGQPA